MSLVLKPQRLVIVGCGALSELYYAPALREACGLASLEVSALYDPSSQRLNILKDFFPAAQLVTNFDELLNLRPNLAIVASPPKFHSAQAQGLLAAGAHVLCEKPMANSVAEAEAMIFAAKESNRLLAIGLFRRFFPALQFISSLIRRGTFGTPRSFKFSEGGSFNWPATSASFFQREQSKGGVLLDLGVHVLDLACWWFGEPAGFLYEDDAMGNLEANCRISLDYPNGLHGVVRLSRDESISNRYVLNFDHASVSWDVGIANQLNLRVNDLPFQLNCELSNKSTTALTYNQCFVRQLLNFANSAIESEALLVPGDEGIRSLRLIESCYLNKHFMSLPWLSQAESVRAHELSRS